MPSLQDQLTTNYRKNRVATRLAGRITRAFSIQHYRIYNPVRKKITVEALYCQCRRDGRPRIGGRAQGGHRTIIAASLTAFGGMATDVKANPLL
jgi:hypothetical protein